MSARSSIEFDAEVHNGVITLPHHVAEGLRQSGGQKFSVRLISKKISDNLSGKEVSEDEIERIGALQLEPRDHVLGFLESQGTLASSGFAKRFRSR